MFYDHFSARSLLAAYSFQDLDSSVMSIARSVCQNAQCDSTLPPSSGHVLQQQDGRSVAPYEYQNQPAVVSTTKDG